MPVSRYSEVTRRAFLGGLSLAAIAGVVGCSAAATASPSATSATASATSSASASATASASAATSKALPSAAKATVAWTFSSSGGGMGGRNPYMAVWLEDASGNFVKTLALYHKANGDNWLNELSAWYSASGGTDTTTSGTVPAGSFTANWDGTTASGDRATQGTYTVCIESAVEHGSESLIRQQVTFGASSATTALTDSGQLSAASVAYTV